MNAVPIHFLRASSLASSLLLFWNEPPRFNEKVPVHFSGGGGIHVYDTWNKILSVVHHLSFCSLISAQTSGTIPSLT